MQAIEKSAKDTLKVKDGSSDSIVTASSATTAAS